MNYKLNGNFSASEATARVTAPRDHSGAENRRTVPRLLSRCRGHYECAHGERDLHYKRRQNAEAGIGLFKRYTLSHKNGAKADKSA